jgi:hypothetical protein
VTRKEEEAEQSQKSPDSANQGAFNEETGEINWDCPVGFALAFSIFA